jgi:PAS domain S-box-containing protein
MATISDLTEYLGKPDGPLGAVLEIFPDMVFVVDQEERILHVNTLAARSLGATPDKLIGRKLGTLFSHAMAERHSHFIQQVFRTGEIAVTETHQELHKTPVWIDSRLVPLKAADGEVRAVVGIIRDVSIRVRTQEALAEREAYLRAMLDNFPFLVWLKDVEGRFLAVNDTFSRACGRASADEVVGLTDFDVWPKELAQNYVDDDRSVMATRKQKDVEETILTQGALRWFETFKTPVLDRLGNVLGTTGFARDITERQLLGEQLRAQREQLRALAAHVESVREEERVRIAREIHDELGQALTCMSMDLAFLDKQLPKENAPAAARVSALATLVRETVKTVRRISSELRPSILDDLGLGAAVEWLAHDFAGRTGIDCAVSVPSNVMVAAERGTVVFRMCQEALTNVARHAGATHVSIDLMIDAEDYLVLEVRDNGRGVTDEEVHRPDSLGLLGMRERAALLGGVAEVKGAPGQGTTVTVRVPLQGSPRDKR